MEFLNTKMLFLDDKGQFDSEMSVTAALTVLYSYAIGPIDVTL